MPVAAESMSRSLQRRAKFQNHDSQSRDNRGLTLTGEFPLSNALMVLAIAPGWHRGSTWLGQM